MRTGAFTIAALAAIFFMPPSEDDRIRRAIYLWKRYQHGRFNCAKALITLRPLLKCLKLQRLSADVGHVEIG